MSYNDKRKTNQASLTENDLQMAMFKCFNGTKIKIIASKCIIFLHNMMQKVGFNLFWIEQNNSELFRICSVCIHVKQIDNLDDFKINKKLNLLPILKKWMPFFYRLTEYDFKWLVYSYAKQNKIDHPESWSQSNCAESDWLMSFLKINISVVLRTPKPTLVSRARCFNCPQVECFFKLLDEQMQKYHIDATTINLMDESGISTTNNKPPKVFSIVGKNK